MRRFLFALVVFSVAGPTPAADPVLQPVRQRMQQFVADNDVAGAVTVVGTPNGYVHLDAVGSLDLASQTSLRTDSLFRIASMTKPITALGIMILADEGKLTPDEPVEKHLPEFRGQKVKTGSKAEPGLADPKRPITLRDLMTHTSGLANYPSEMGDVYRKRNRTLAETTKAVAGLPLVFEPGAKWSYSNPGIDTLGRVIEVVSGEPYHLFLQKRVFDPLAMTASTFYPTAEQQKRLATVYNKKDGKLVADANLMMVMDAAEPKHPIPAGGLVSNGPDLSIFYQMLLNGGELSGRRIISAKNLQEMVRTQTADIPTGFVDGMSFGYGFAVVKEPKGVTAVLSRGTFGHGGAFGTQSWADPSRQLFFILLIGRTGLSNGDASPMRREFQEIAVRTLTTK